MITERDFYKLSDAAIKLLDGRIARRGRQAEQRMLIDDFDELNVINTMRDLYDLMEKDNMSVYLDLAQMVWLKAGGAKDRQPDEGWLYELLTAYDPVTLYVYMYEVDRKRDRTTEAINSSQGQTAKTAAFERGLRDWRRMTEEYSDEVTFQAAVDAFRDQGVDQVIWQTAEDERVCAECAPRNGIIYNINNVPPRPHWGCRCTITPI